MMRRLILLFVLLPCEIGQRRLFGLFRSACVFALLCGQCMSLRVVNAFNQSKRQGKQAPSSSSPTSPPKAAVHETQRTTTHPTLHRQRHKALLAIAARGLLAAQMWSQPFCHRDPLLASSTPHHTPPTLLPPLTPPPLHIYIHIHIHRETQTRHTCQKWPPLLPPTTKRRKPTAFS